MKKFNNNDCGCGSKIKRGKSHKRIKRKKLILKAKRKKNLRY